MGNNPVNATDPTGQCPMCIGGAIGGAAGYLVSVGKQVFFDGKGLGDALTSKQALGAAVAGAVSGATLGFGSSFVAGSYLAGTTAGTVAQAGLAAGVAVPATLAANAATGDKLPTGRDLAAAAAGNVVGLGVGMGAAALGKQGAIETAVAVSMTNVSESTANTIVTSAVVGGQVAAEVFDEIADTTTESMIKQSPPSGGACRPEPSGGGTGGC